LNKLTPNSVRVTLPPVGQSSVTLPLSEQPETRVRLGGATKSMKSNGGSAANTNTHKEKQARKKKKGISI
jgi:hypothetical protein